MNSPGCTGSVNYLINEQPSLVHTFDNKQLLFFRVTFCGFLYKSILMKLLSSWEGCLQISVVDSEEPWNHCNWLIFRLHTAQRTHSTAYCPLNNRYCTRNTAESTLHTLHYTLNTSHCALRTAHSVQWVYLVNCIVLSEHITFYTLNCSL